MMTLREVLGLPLARLKALSQDRYSDKQWKWNNGNPDENVEKSSKQEDEYGKDV